MKNVVGIAVLGIVLAARLAPAQESAQLIAAPEVIGGLQDSFRIAPDLNGDGDKDAVSVWFASPSLARVAGFWNDGTGALTQGWVVNLPMNLAGAPSPVAVRFAAGDLNGDGAEDFVITVDRWVGWWISHGDVVTPDVPWGLMMPNTVFGLAVADFDGDGRADVALALASEVRIYLTQAAGAPVLSSTLPLPANDGRGLVALHANADATPDLGLVRLAAVDLLPVVAGVIQPGTTFPTYSSPDASLLSGDIDGDSDEDVIASVSSNLPTSTIGLMVLRRTGPSSFSAEPWQVFSSPPLFLTGLPRALVDSDGDGDLDLLGLTGLQGFYNIGVTTGGNVTLQACYLRRNDGTGAFGDPTSWTILGATADFAVPDLDGDGDADFVGGRCVDFARFGRGFAHDVARPVSGLSPMADFDRDGDADMTPGIAGTTLAGFPAPGTATNDGSGVFVEAPSVAPPPPPGTGWAGPGFAGDFDGDGYLDLVVEHFSGTGPSGAFEMRLMMNLGGGSFADFGPATATGTTMRSVPTTGATGSALIDTIDNRSALVADVDGDGDLDLVPYVPASGTQGAPPQGSLVWLNTGTGFFTAQGSGFPGFRPTGAGDVNGDATPDLLGVQAPAGTIAVVVLPGLGGGAFGAPVQVSAPYTLQDTNAEPALGDVDGDGDLDVALPVQGAMAVFVNGGLGGFTQTNIGPFDTGTSTVVRMADMNADGLVDLLASTAGPNATCRIWLRDPANSGWLPQRTWSTSIGAVSDVDGDGDLDVLGGGVAFPPWVFHRNATFAPPTNGFRRQYGTGLAGSGGLVPILGTAGVLRAGFSGSLRITNALGGAAALFGAGTAQANQPLFGGTLLIVPAQIVPLVLGGAPGIAGAGYLEVPWTMPPGLAGFHAFEQAAISDPGAPQGLAFTQGVEIIIGS